MKQEFDTIEDLLSKVYNELLRRRNEIERDILDCEMALSAVQKGNKLPPFSNRIPEPEKMVDPAIVIAEMVDENNLHSYLHANKPI